MSALTTFEKSRGQADFLAPFAHMRREIDKLFDQADPNSWSSLGDRNLAGLRMDVAETNKAIVVSAELPGVDIEDIDVSLSGGILTIKGEKRSEHDKKDADFHVVERSFGAFERRISVPEDCPAASIKAEYASGVLTVTIPKPANAAPAAKIKITKS